MPNIVGLPGQFSDAEEDNDQHSNNYVQHHWPKEQSRVLLANSVPETHTDSLSDGDSYLESDDDDFTEDCPKAFPGSRRIGKGPNAQKQSEPSSQPVTKYITELLDRAHINTIGSEFPGDDLGGNENHTRRDRRSERATTEQVFDKTTQTIIKKWLNNGFFSNIYGCISTGKEANVYYAVTSSGEEYAVKIFKTSCTIFKDREKYIIGNHKFRKGYNKSSTQNIVRTWVEKEYGNLTRLERAGLPVPKVIKLKPPIIVMEFLGEQETASPKLKDISLSGSKFKQIYKDLLINMWKMFHKCDIVHADLSEYNILYHKERAYIIDVSQSVQTTHPQAMNFLRKDCINVTEFFRRKNIPTLTSKELFCFIINPDTNERNVEKKLNGHIETAGFRDFELSHERECEEAIFKSAEITLQLNEILIGGFNGKSSTLDYISTPDPLERRRSQETLDDELSAEDSLEEESSDEESEAEVEGEFPKGDRVTKRVTSGQSTEERKERKKLLHEQRAEKRQNKVLRKGEKKRKVLKTKRNPRARK